MLMRITINFRGFPILEWTSMRTGGSSGNKDTYITLEGSDSPGDYDDPRGHRNSDC
jgi:hypothetical protein